jgi:NIMA (never in mitosis gene a)-related kinase
MLPQEQPIIVNRIKGFLSESVRQSEFSHTVLHNKVFKPESGLANIKQVVNELPCPPQLLQQKSQPQPEPPKKEEVKKQDLTPPPKPSLPP